MKIVPCKLDNYRSFKFAVIALQKFTLFRLVLLVKLLFNNCSNIGHENFTKMCSIL